MNVEKVDNIHNREDLVQKPCDANRERNRNL